MATMITRLNINRFYLLEQLKNVYMNTHTLNDSKYILGKTICPALWFCKHDKMIEFVLEHILFIGWQGHTMYWPM
jgi:hypothetical protein